MNLFLGRVPLESSSTGIVRSALIFSIVPVHIILSGEKAKCAIALTDS